MFLWRLLKQNEIKCGSGWFGAEVSAYLDVVWKMFEELDEELMASCAYPLLCLPFCSLHGKITNISNNMETKQLTFSKTKNNNNNTLIKSYLCLSWIMLTLLAHSSAQTKNSQLFGSDNIVAFVSRNQPKVKQKTKYCIQRVFKSLWHCEIVDILC